MFSPVDDGHRLPIGTVTVREDLIIYSDVLEALDGAKWRAWEDGLDHTWRGNIVFDRDVQHGRRDGGRERLGFYKSNTGRVIPRPHGSLSETIQGRNNHTCGINYSET